VFLNMKALRVYGTQRSADLIWQRTDFQGRVPIFTIPRYLPSLLDKLCGLDFVVINSSYRKCYVSVADPRTDDLFQFRNPSLL
jgi:hypothetical protein